MATNETSPAHTAIPWSVKRIYPPGDFSRYEIWSGEDQVATLEVRGADQDNAEFIVRACNAHDELLDAARAAYRALRELAWHQSFADDAPEFNEGGCGYEAMAALKSAIEIANAKAS